MSRDFSIKAEEYPMKYTKKARFIQNLESLTPAEKVAVIKFFSEHPNYESLIDWNNRHLQCTDFETVFKKTKYANRTIKKKGKENLKFLFKKYKHTIGAKRDNFMLVYPCNWECAVFMNSYRCGGVKTHWCIGNKNDSSF